MAVHLEIWKPSGREVRLLTADSLSIGNDSANPISLGEDDEVSHMHALLERLPAGWCIRDLQSTNGTFVNGRRLVGQRPLRGGDEIRVGATRLVFRSDEPRHDDTTPTAKRPPELTRREHDVLIALCQPLLSGDVFTEPASVKEIAEELQVTDAAIKQHLANLYVKFEIYDVKNRRVSLANHAIRRGAVRIGDLTQPPDPR